MHKHIRTSISLALLTLAGCGSGRMSDQERLKHLIPNASKVTPVRGNLRVDGKPEKDVFIYLIPKGTQMPTNVPPDHRALSKADGTFAITTYLDGDGAPAGDYVICLEWLTYKQSKDSWVGPDKFGGRYNDPGKSEFAVTVDPTVEGFLDIEVSAVGADLSKPASATMTQRESKSR